jgi:sugar phosphate permease
LVEGFSKLLVPPVLYLLGLRNVWLLVLGVGCANMVLVSTLATLPVLFATVVLQALIYAWIFPATTVAVAGWIDGHQLGRAFGVISVATKITPMIMSPWYSSMQSGPDAWRNCYLASALIAGSTLVLVFVFFRSSAASLGFRPPTPPGKPKDADSEGSSSLLSRSHLVHPLANESMGSVLWIVVRMRRTWALLGAFCLLCLLRQGSQFASVYARQRLHVASSVSSNLYTTYNIAAACAGLCGGFIYDVVPGGKLGIGVFMTMLNLLNLCGFGFALYLELTETVTMTNLHIFMGVIGFAGVLPVSLPFQVYAMAVGGVKHCAVIVATFEFVAHFVESGIDLLTGELLEQHEFETWLVINVAFAVLGAVCMALFYWLDWRRAPGASTLTAAPDLDIRDKKSIARSLRFAAQQAQTKEDVEAANKGRLVQAFSAGSLKSALKPQSEG